MVTAVAAFLAGAGLFAIAARGIRAGTIHFLTGNMASALIVGSLAFACFVAALTFLMPGRLRRVVRAGEQPRLRTLVRLGAICVLFVLLIGAAVTDRAAGERILGLVPHAALWPVALAFALLFTLAFILPGLAYRTDPAVTSPVPSVPKAPRPLPKLAWSVNDIRSPALRRVLQTAIKYAENGFPVAPRVAWDWSRFVDKLKADPSRALSVGEVRQHLAEKRKRPASA